MLARVGVLGEKGKKTPKQNQNRPKTLYEKCWWIDSLERSNRGVRTFLIHRELNKTVFWVWTEVQIPVLFCTGIAPVYNRLSFKPGTKDACTGLSIHKGLRLLSSEGPALTAVSGAQGLQCCSPTRARWPSWCARERLWVADTQRWRGWSEKCSAVIGLQLFLILHWETHS